MNDKCPLNKEERKVVTRNMKSILIRNLYKKLFSEKLVILSALAKEANLNFEDFLFSFIPNKKFDS
jgi:hypothetical protein